MHGQDVTKQLALIYLATGKGDKTKSFVAFDNTNVVDLMLEWNY
jgi:hypothetical protein